MAFAFQKTYNPEIERLLCQYYQSLSEKDRRRFAALEAITLGHGGTRYIAQVLGCDPQTVKDGMRELKQLPDDPAGRRVRKPGDGCSMGSVLPGARWPRCCQAATRRIATHSFAISHLSSKSSWRPTTQS